MSNAWAVNLGNRIKDVDSKEKKSSSTSSSSPLHRSLTTTSIPSSSPHFKLESSSYFDDGSGSGDRSLRRSARKKPRDEGSSLEEEGSPGSLGSVRRSARKKAQEQEFSTQPDISFDVTEVDDTPLEKIRSRVAKGSTFKAAMKALRGSGTVLRDQMMSGGKTGRVEGGTGQGSGGKGLGSGGKGLGIAALSKSVKLSRSIFDSGGPGKNSRNIFDSGGSGKKRKRSFSVFSPAIITRPSTSVDINTHDSRSSQFSQITQDNVDIQSPQSVNTQSTKYWDPNLSIRKSPRSCSNHQSPRYSNRSQSSLDTATSESPNYSMSTSESPSHSMSLSLVQCHGTPIVKHYPFTQVNSIHIYQCSFIHSFFPLFQHFLFFWFL